MLIYMLIHMYEIPKCTIIYIYVTMQYFYTVEWKGDFGEKSDVWTAKLSKVLDKGGCIFELIRSYMFLLTFISYSGDKLEFTHCIKVFLNTFISLISFNIRQ
jgi:hypothetical protein